MRSRIVLTAAAAVLSGCVALAPTSIPIGIEHVSHMTQHRPFTDHPDNYGYSGVFAGLKWQRGRGSVTLQEEYTKDRLDGYHEVFEARVEYDVPLRRGRP